MVRDLADVQQPVLAGQDIDQRAEVQDLGDRAFVDLADLGLGRDLGDALEREGGLVGVGGGHGDGAVLGDVDRAAGLLGQCADGRATLADDVADLLLVDLHRVQARCELAHLGLGTAHRLDHLGQDVQTRFLGLRQRHLHDLLGDALDLDVHLQRRDAAMRAGDLEVHVAQMILVAQDVGQHREAVAFLDQAHGDAGHVRLQRHAGVEQAQAAATHAGHRGRTVALGHFRNDAHRVRELVLLRQHRDQRALGQAAVADFAPLGATEAARLAGGEGRHVVVQHEVVGELAGQRIDALRVAFGAQRGHHQRLRLAAREEGTAMGARQHAGADLDRPHGACVTAVDARLARQDLAAHQARFDVEQQRLDLDAVEGHAFGLQRGHHIGVGVAAGLRARLLAADLVGGAQRLLGQRGDLGNEGLVLGRGLPVPFRLAGFAHQFVDGIDGDLAHVVAEDHGAEHHLFGELVCFGLHHQHGGLGAGHHQVELALGELGLARVEHVLAVDVAHARGADGAIERDAADAQCGAGADHGGDIGRHLGVQAQHVHDDLDLVVEALGEQRPDRAVDEAAGQHLQFTGAAFALEEAAGNLARGIGLLGVVHREREEVLAFLGVGLGHHGGQHHRVVDIHDDGAAGLARDFAGLHGDLVRAPLEGLGDLVEHAHTFVSLREGSAMPFQGSPRHVGSRRLWNDTAVRPGWEQMPGPHEGGPGMELICAGRGWRSARYSGRRPCPSGRPAGACAG